MYNYNSSKVPFLCFRRKGTTPSPIKGVTLDKNQLDPKGSYTDVEKGFCYAKKIAKRFFWRRPCAWARTDVPPVDVRPELAGKANAELAGTANAELAGIGNAEPAGTANTVKARTAVVLVLGQILRFLFKVTPFNQQ